MTDGLFNRMLLDFKCADSILLLWLAEVERVSTNSCICPVFPNMGVGAPPKDHKINLRGHEMINGRGKKC